MTEVQTHRFPEPAEIIQFGWEFRLKVTDGPAQWFPCKSSVGMPVSRLSTEPNDVRAPILETV